MIDDLIEMLKRMNANIDVVKVDRPLGQRYNGIEHKKYTEDTIESWVEMCLRVIDETQPLYLWDIEVVELEDRQEIAVYGSMSFK